MSEALRRVLQERHRVPLNGKVQWPTGAELVLRRGLQEAEKGNATLRRELTNLLLRSEERSGEGQMLVVTDPAGSSADTGLRFTPMHQEDKES